MLQCISHQSSSTAGNKAGAPARLVDYDSVTTRKMVLQPPYRERTRKNCNYACNLIQRPKTIRKKKKYQQ